MRSQVFVVLGAMAVLTGCATARSASSTPSVRSVTATDSLAAPSLQPSSSVIASVERSAAPSDPATGFHDVGGGRRLWLECQGSGSPTIVIDVGNDDTIHGSWDLVFGPMAEIGHVCAYDRANLGQSDPAPGPRTVSDLAEDLVTLLDVADVPGPYVFVGGSFGGNIVGDLAAAHPNLVAGTVFVDSEPTNLDPALDPLRSNLTTETYAACCRDFGPPAADSPDNTDRVDYQKSAATDAASVRRQPKVPTRVLTATDIDCEPDWPCDAILKAEIKLQSFWIAGNPKGKQIMVSSNHVMQRQAPDAIVDATKAVLDAIKG